VPTSHGNTGNAPSGERTGWNQTLVIGAENWPTPIPLVHKGNTWYFDTEAGRKKFYTGELPERDVRHPRLPGAGGG